MQDSRRKPAWVLHGGAATGWRCLALGLAIASLLHSACNRAHYRRQADAEAAALVREKIIAPRWEMPRPSIAIDPRSRMFDPFDPDHPPMPPDDPASHELMHVVDGKPNYPHWGKDGSTDHVEAPAWLKYLPLDGTGVLRLDLATSVDLALLHSPEYQQAYETLYLSALDVSAERFRFDGQWYGGFEPFYRTSGINRNLPRSRFGVDSNPNFRRAFIAGGNLVVNFANSLVWDFHGSDTNAAFSLLDFSLVQPLLREGGRDRVLTRLTLAERQLLANVRQMERFRSGFYLDLATGTGSARGAQRIGGLFGGSGLEGFTGVGGGFGGIGNVFTGASGAQAAGAALQVGGFLGLLQDQQNIRNQRTNIAGLRSNVIQFQQTLRENLRQIPDDPTEVVRNQLQIAQARQNLFNQEFALTTAQAQYQTRIDQLKIDLGLPPHVPVEIDDPLLDRFNLLDPLIVPLQDRISQLSQTVGTINERILAAVSYTEVDGRRQATLEWSPELAGQLAQLAACLDEMELARNELLTGSLPRAEQDIGRLRQVLPERRFSLQRLNQKYPTILGPQEQRAVRAQTRLPASVDPEILDRSRLDNLEQDLQQDFARLQQKLQAYETRSAQVRASLEQVLARPAEDQQSLYERLEEDVIFAIPGMLAGLTSDLLDLSLIQARARSDAIDLVPVDLEMNLALRIAALKRPDWMNARASLVDTWRSIAFVANDLEAYLNLVAEGDVANRGDNPLDFRSSDGTLRVGLRFDPPFTRLLERNTYREVLIDYQQARRGYYQFVDRVSLGLRNTIRSLELNELNFETRRLAVLSAIEQIVLNNEIQTLNEERGLAQGVTAARDIVQALSDLQDAQDAFMGVWITYEVSRRFLDFNLGTMQLDARGMWVDPGPIRGGVAPYVATACPEDLELQQAPGDQRWPAGEELELLPPAEPAPDGPDAPHQVRQPEGKGPPRDLIRLPAASAAA